MAILLVVTDRDVTPLQHKIEVLLEGETEVWVYPDLPDPEKVEMAVLWKHPKGILQQLPALKVVSSLGAGVEHVLRDSELPNHVRVARIVDEQLNLSMRNYVLMSVLSIQRSFRFMLENQRARTWQKPEPAERKLRIGVLGLGQLGGAVARVLRDLSFEVWGYSLRPRAIEGVRCQHAAEMTPVDFAAQVNLLVCLLPATPGTEGILNQALFNRMPAGSFLVNVARGVHLVEPDLVEAIKSGQIKEAYLDVFQEEPLPLNHPFWNYSQIVITPHVASITNQDNAAAIIAENYRRLKKGKELLYEVDPKVGY